MPRRGWMTAALLSAAFLLAACKTELYSGLSEQEANEIVAALVGSGIPASKQAARGEGITVMVDDGRFAEAMALLNARGLPATQYESFGDVFERKGIVSSPVEERARYIYALSQELSRTIAEIDGVLSARIHVVLPETDMLGRDFKPSSASVFIRHAAEAPVAEFTAQIKLLVANSIEGLVYDNVTVVAIPVAESREASGTVPELTRVAGIWVHPQSVTQLWLTLGGLLLTALAGLGLALWLTLTRRLRARGDGFDMV